MDRSVWTLQTVNGMEARSLSSHRDVGRRHRRTGCGEPRTGLQGLIIPVLPFPDTPQDRLIEEWAGQLRVKVLFGADDLMDRLLGLADSVGVKHPPTAGRIRNEVAAVTSGLVAPARDGGGHEAVQEFMARQVVIQHVDTVNIYVTLAHVDGRDPQRLPAAGPISTSPPAG